LWHVSGAFDYSLESWCSMVSFTGHTTLICKVSRSQKCKCMPDVLGSVIGCIM